MQRVIVLLLIYLPRKDERLSWPSWPTYSGRFTHIAVTRRLQAEDRTGSVRRPKTDVLPTVLRNRRVCMCVWYEGLADEVRADFNVMKDLAVHTRIGPADRVKRLQKFISDIARYVRLYG